MMLYDESYPEIILNNVVLPRPFLPTKPYLLPHANVTSVF